MIEFENYLNVIINNIKQVREFAIETDSYNDQWFLDFLDKINTLSIDPSPEEIEEYKKMINDNVEV